VTSQPQYLGAAMSKLSIQEQTFVCLLFSCKTAIEAYEKAFGTAPADRKSLASKCSYLSHTRRITDAIREEDAARMVLLGTKAQQALEAIVENPQHQDHFKAVKLSRDDAGMTRPVQKEISVKVEITQAEKVQRIRQWAQAKGLDIVKLLGFDPGEVTDAEFTELPPPEPDVHDLAELL